MKKILCLLITTILLLITNLNASANTTQQNIMDWHYHTFSDGTVAPVFGSESIGWEIMEFQHFGTTGTVKYRFEDNVSLTYRSRFTNGAALWSSATSATFQNVTDTSTTANVTVKNATLNTGIVALAVPTSISGDFHYHATNWIIKYNSNENPTKITFAHELGHVFGLVDLNNSSNINKLMYFNESRTAINPTANDIKGFNVATGVHNSHSWAYTSNSYRKCNGCGGISTYNHPYTWTNYNDSLHKGYCSHCNQTLYASHTKNTFVNENSTKHRAYCKCSKDMGLENHTKDTFVSQNAAQHKVYCKCGKYRGLENHTPNSTNTGCTLCNYVGSVGGTVSYPGDDD